MELFNKVTCYTMSYRAVRMMAIPKSSMSPLEHQQFQRLKVNRIAVLQELKVDHILHYLLSKSVLNRNDITKIEKGRSTTEKSKLLLDILPTKGRASNWYKHFRSALLNPSVEDTSVKHKYQILVEFLDNTIIDQMSHPIRVSNSSSTITAQPQLRTADAAMTSLSKYKPLPEITNSPSTVLQPAALPPAALPPAALIPSPPPAQLKGVRRRTPTKQSPASPQPVGDSNKPQQPRISPLRADVDISALNDETLPPEMEDLTTSRWNIRQLKGKWKITGIMIIVSI